MYVPITSHKQKIREANRIFQLPHGTWKDNTRSVIFDRRQGSSGPSNEEERSAGLPSEERDPLVTQADLSAPRVCSLAVALLHKKGFHLRRKICANSLGVYSYGIQSSPSENKNMNHIFINLWVFPCLSSGSVYNMYSYCISADCTAYDIKLHRMVDYHIYQPSAQAGYDIRSIFKRSLTGLISEYSFS